MIQFLHLMDFQRSGIPPFTKARDVLITSTDKIPSNILYLCHCLPLEVVDLKIGIIIYYRTD